VNSADDLLGAVARGDTHIEIQSHLDLSHHAGGSCGSIRTSCSPSAKSCNDDDLHWLPSASCVTLGDMPDSVQSIRV
jgi:hypothetical protein